MFKLRLLLLCIWVSAGSAWAAGPSVVVRPFEVFSAPEIEALAPGLQAMLASRLAGTGYTVTTASPGQEPASDWAVRTTVTHLSGVYSVDAALEPVQAGGDGMRTYETARSADALLPALEAVAARIKEALVRKAAERPSAPPAPAPAAAVPVPTPVPTPVPATPPAPPPSAAPAAPAAAQPPPAVAPAPQPVASDPSQSLEATLAAVLRKPRMGPELDGEARSLVAVDADRDGKVEVLVLMPDAVVAFRDTGADLVRVWDAPNPSGFQALTLSTADVDRNGVPEVFVAGLSGTRPVSQALEWFGSALAPKGERIAAFVRAVPHREGGSPLLGQTPGTGKDLFQPDIREFVWDGRAYRPGDVVRIPSSALGINIEWAHLVAGEGAYALVSSQDDRLEIIDPAGDVVYETSERVKGTRTVLKGPERVLDYLDEDRVSVQGKTGQWIPPGGDSPILILPRNEGSLPRILGIATYSHGQVTMYRWDGLALANVAEGPKLPNFIPDLAVAPANGRPGAASAYAALVKFSGTLVKTASSRVIAYDLPAGGALPPTP